MTDDPDRERVQKRSNERRRERTESVEKMTDRVGRLLGEHKYPTTSEELATEYADDPIDLPNETESLGSVFDRLVDERFESAEEAREALFGELTGEAGPPVEYNEERDLDHLAEEAKRDESEGSASDM